MSDIVLSSSVRQNLLSLQSTANLLSSTQNRLSTGNKVNSALDGPNAFFTSLALDNRASDITNLLDGMANGIQVIDAANTGITSLQKLVDTAKSVASQALQATSGYSAKSTATTAAVTGATAANLLGTASGYSEATVTTPQALTNLGSVTTTANTLLRPNFGSDTLTTVDGDYFTVNGVTVAFSSAQTTKTGNATAGFVLGIGGGSTLKVQDILDSIDAITGTSIASTIDGTGHAVIHTGTASDLTITDNTSLNTLANIFGGLPATTTQRIAGQPPLSGKTLTVGATGGGAATSITFGTGAGQVSTLDQLNTALAANNLTATIGSNGALTFITTNDTASATIGAFGGSAVGASNPFGAVTASAPVADANAQNTRASLVRQYNAVISQIGNTTRDASFNGVNLLDGDQLKLVFNETGKSALTISGVTDDIVGLGLGSLSVGSDFLDNAQTQKVMDKLTTASGTLRAQASSFGSNLSIVQIRQDFSKSLIDVLQTGASNLTLADTNEEAANSQALSTRQSIAVSALALANQSQQGVLQLLR